MDALEHGTLNTYVTRRCRCLDCKAASSAYCRALYRRRAYGRVVELVDVDQVQTHLRWLAGHGIGWEQVPQLAGVGRNTVDQILRPTRRRRGVTPRVAGAILAVLPTLDNAAAGALIDSTGTRRRLQALMLTGHTLTAIQSATGASALGRVMTRDTATARIARLVRDYYDTHWNVPPAATTAADAAMVARTIARAERDGFLPALAWDDDLIDDPSAVADVTAVRPPPLSVRIHLEDVEDLARFGATWDEAERRTGAVRNSIEVACGRAGRPDLVARITSNRWVAA